MDKLLAKDVAKGKIKEEEAREVKEMVEVGQHGEMADVDMVIEVSIITCFQNPDKLMRVIWCRRSRRI